MNQCTNCNKSLEVSKEDLDFLDKMSPIINEQKYQIPPPTLCPNCREQRRLNWRNLRNLYQRTCSSCDKSIISNFKQESPFPVYCGECYWSDKWDALDIGRDFDFSRSFFEQFNELRNQAPHPYLKVINSVNSEYGHALINCKNCYMVFRGGECEDTMYGWLNLNCTNCVDCYNAFGCQYCYEIIDGHNSYQSTFCQNIKDSRDCHYSYDLSNCSDCFGCWNLRNKQYQIFNKQYSKEDYFEKIKSFQLNTSQGRKWALEQYENVKKQAIRKDMSLINCEGCTGDEVVNSKNCHLAFDTSNAEDCRYCWGAVGKDIMDGCFIHHGERVYECLGELESFNVRFSVNDSNCQNQLYSVYGHNGASNNFGCVSLNKKQYCILNKQYTKEEYEELVPKIIGHMKTTGEWGEFYPIQIAPFAYNESMAQEPYPLTKEVAEVRGYKWLDRDEKQYRPSTCQIPSSIDETTENITKEILACEDCEKNYKIIKSELKFYKKFGITVPTKCQDCRYMNRFKQRNLHYLHPRTCDKCGINTQSPYSQDSDRTVYCNKCYLESVY